MPGNYNGVITGAFDYFVGPFNCVIYIAAVLIVDKGVIAIPECVTESQHMRLFKIDRYVSIRVTGAVVVYMNCVPGKDECRAVIYEYRGTRRNRYRQHGPVPIVNVSGLGQVLQGVLMRNDGCARLLHPFITVSMIPVPVSVYDIYDR